VQGNARPSPPSRFYGMGAGESGARHGLSLRPLRMRDWDGGLCDRDVREEGEHPMALLNETVRGQLAEILGSVPHGVDLLLYPGPDAETADLMRSLLQEMAETVPQVRLQEVAEAPELEPGHDTGMPIEGPITQLRRDDGTLTGARFLGIPGGMEFGALVEAIRAIGTGDVELAPETMKTLEQLEAPVHIQVFTTPTCPYCPHAVRLAQQMAIASPKVTADMVDASTYGELSDKYQVMGVPAQFFNGTLTQVGAAPEGRIRDLVKEAAHRSQTRLH